MSTPHTTSVIRITSVPPGEAPLWVRERWVGLELPAHGPASPRHYRTFGVVTGPRSFLAQWWAALLGRTQRTSGYAVSGQAALAVLEAAHPDAAAWWRENAPHHFRWGRYLVFHDSACTPLPPPRAP